MHVSIMNMDRHWFALKKCIRDDQLGYWSCEKLAPGPAAEKQQASKVRFMKYKDPRAQRLSSSIVHVQFDIPYHIDGIQEAEKLRQSRRCNNLCSKQKRKANFSAAKL